jgi:ribosomal protein L40E
MSVPQKVIVACPRCNTSLNVTVWDSVNTDLSADLPQKVISGEFFDHICPACGFVCHIEYPTLYHDMKHGAMIWIVHKDASYNKRIQEIRNSIIIPGDLTRIVHSTAELREKVSILESGRDDCVIEIQKYLQILHYNQINPELGVVEASYSYDRGMEMITFHCADGHQFRPPYTTYGYDLLSQNLRPVLSTLSLPHYAIIDQDWAKQIFCTHFSALTEEAEDQGLTVIQLIAMRALERENEELKRKRTEEVIRKESQKSSGDMPDSSVKFCRKCGEKLSGDSLSCHKCGTKVLVPSEADKPSTSKTQTAPASKTVPQDKKPHKKCPKWIAPLLAAVVIATALLLLNLDYLKATFVYDVIITEKHEISMVVGGTHSVSYSVDPQDLSKSEIEWESSDSSIARISGKGVIAAKGEGTATITASINGVTKDSCTVKVSLKPVSVRNGQMIVSPKYTGYPEVTINAPTDADCFVYFENINNSANDFAFYVTAGSSATVNAPAGTYNFFYATGDTWYGKELKFGKDTNFYKSPDQMILTEDSTGYDILELTLYVVPNGNMDTDPIGENEFPI